MSVTTSLPPLSDDFSEPIISSDTISWSKLWSEMTLRQKLLDEYFAKELDLSISSDELETALNILEEARKPINSFGFRGMVRAHNGCRYIFPMQNDPDRRSLIRLRKSLQGNVVDYKLFLTLTIDEDNNCRFEILPTQHERQLSLSTEISNFIKRLRKQLSDNFPKEIAKHGQLFYLWRIERGHPCESKIDSLYEPGSQKMGNRLHVHMLINWSFMDFHIINDCWKFGITLGPRIITNRQMALAYISKYITKTAYNFKEPDGSTKKVELDLSIGNASRRYGKSINSTIQTVDDNCLNTYLGANDYTIEEIKELDDACHDFNAKILIKWVMDTYKCNYEVATKMLEDKSIDLNRFYMSADRWWLYNNITGLQHPVKTKVRSFNGYRYIPCRAVWWHGRLIWRVNEWSESMNSTIEYYLEIDCETIVNPALNLDLPYRHVSHHIQCIQNTQDLNMYDDYD